MQSSFAHPLPDSEIKSRVSAVNLTLKALALRASIAPSTAYRGARRMDTAGRLTDALVAEEKRLLAHLLALHGVPADAARDAA